MPLTVQDILKILEDFAPVNLAESWDNVGLMVGNPEQRVSSILLGLDPTEDLITEAVSSNANVIITHHPLIFHPLKSLNTNTATGQFIARAISHSISVISCHTNLDSTTGGVSDILAEGLGLEQTKPLTYSSSDLSCEQCGLGRVGIFSTPVTPDDFIDRLKNTCSPPWLLASGSRPSIITKAAVCGGSCSELAPQAKNAGAQVFVTAEVKHNIARWAEQENFWVIDAGHFSTEQPAIIALEVMLQKQLNELSETIPVHSAIQASPMQLI